MSESLPEEITEDSKKLTVRAPEEIARQTEGIDVLLGDQEDFDQPQEGTDNNNPDISPLFPPLEDEQDPNVSQKRHGFLTMVKDWARHRRDQRNLLKRTLAYGNYQDHYVSKLDGTYAHDPVTGELRLRESRADRETTTKTQRTRDTMKVRRDVVAGRTLPSEASGRIAQARAQRHDNSAIGQNRMGIKDEVAGFADQAQTNRPQRQQVYQSPDWVARQKGKREASSQPQFNEKHLGLLSKEIEKHIKADEKLIRMTQDVDELTPAQTARVEKGNIDQITDEYMGQAKIPASQRPDLRKAILAALAASRTKKS